MPDSSGFTLGHNQIEGRKEGGKRNGSGNPHGTGDIARACLELGARGWGKVCLSWGDSVERHRQWSNKQRDTAGYLELKEVGESFQTASNQCISM